MIGSGLEHGKLAECKARCFGSMIKYDHSDSVIAYYTR